MKHAIFTKILSLLCLCATLFAVAFPTASFAAPKTARADTPVVGTYACILQTDTYFYAAPDETKGLFLLPATYYVKLLEYGATYSRVEYLYDDSKVKKVTGYAKTDRLTFVDYVPKRPYFYQIFDVRYRIDEGLETDGFLNEIVVTCAYYGDYNIGSKTYCYVLQGEEFGYVPKPADVVVRENTEYADYLAQQAPSSDSDTPKESSSPAQIAILVALCLLVPLLAALILKPPRRPPYETE